jgi:hypothetical protein
MGQRGRQVPALVDVTLKYLAVVLVKQLVQFIADVLQVLHRELHASHSKVFVF